jgi:hypothetical protein
MEGNNMSYQDSISNPIEREDAMNFSDALVMLKQGHKIKRFGWDDEEYIVVRKVTDMSYDTGLTYTFTWIGVCTNDDILAEDWMVIG